MRAFWVTHVDSVYNQGHIGERQGDQREIGWVRASETGVRDQDPRNAGHLRQLEKVRRCILP